MSPLPAGVAELLPAYLAVQRWFAGGGKEAPPISVERASRLWEGDGNVRLWHAIISSADRTYQLLIGERPAADPKEFLHGREAGVIGGAADSYFYDATLDAELAREILHAASRGELTAKRIRPVNADQTNTSLVFDDQVILKLFRRLHPGRNPDVEVTTALYNTGFRQVAEPLVTWVDAPYDLGFGQEFLAGGLEGWALAVTSLRDLYSSEEPRPENAGGDFGSEARRLGRMTADMHVSLAEAFGVHSSYFAEHGWPALLEGLPTRLANASDVARIDLVRAGEPLLERLRAVSDPGPAIRVHGDYHLGQVMQTDAGWHVLDFEGEPAVPFENRTRPTSALKDVTGMLRSFQYASHFVLSERAEDDVPRLIELADAWEIHNRNEFLDGYRSVAKVADLLPSPDVGDVALTAFEIDKALYELDYELAYRPDWAPIPTAALARLLDRGDG